MEAVDVNTLGRAQLEARLRTLMRARAAIDAETIAISRRLEALAAEEHFVPELVIAGAGRSSLREARHAARRVEVLDVLPAFESSLAAGEVTVAHVDVLSRAVQRLEPDRRSLLTGFEDHLLTVARHAAPEDFERTVRRTASRLVLDDGLQRLDRQKRAAYLKHWTNRETGMHHLHAELDPESAMRFVARLESRVEALFHAAVPDTCPTGERRNEHLNLLALVDLVDGAGAGVGQPGRAEVCVVIDEQTLRTGLHEGSHIDTGSQLELPVESIRRLACTAEIIPIVLDGHGVVVDVGRAQRLANRAQRRALRAMSRTCEVPGCSVAGRHCQPHHIRWWRNGGGTDLSNLVLLCSQHHHAVHEGGWQLLLRADSRVLTVTLPDGTTMTNGPPSARAG